MFHIFLRNDQLIVIGIACLLFQIGNGLLIMIVNFEESHAKDASDISVPNPYIIVNQNTRLPPTEYPNSK